MSLQHMFLNDFIKCQQKILIVILESGEIQISVPVLFRSKFKFSSGEGIQILKKKY